MSLLPELVWDCKAVTKQMPDAALAGLWKTVLLVKPSISLTCLFSHDAFSMQHLHLGFGMLELLLLGLGRWERALESLAVPMTCCGSSVTSGQALSPQGPLPPSCTLWLGNFLIARWYLWCLIATDDIYRYIYIYLYIIYFLPHERWKADIDFAGSFLWLLFAEANVEVSERRNIIEENKIIVGAAFLKYLSLSPLFWCGWSCATGEQRPLQPWYCVSSQGCKCIFCRKAGEDLLGGTR